MKLDKNAVRILCFGDSNTWGQNDDKNYGSRYNLNIRWPGRIQKLLGDKFEIYEEGLGGRNTTFEHYDTKKTYRNGIEYFKPFLQSHDIFDLVIIMLGTNDLKIQYDQSLQDIVSSIDKYISYIKQDYPLTKILVVSPPFVDDKAPLFADYYSEAYDSQGAEKSQSLGAELSELCHQRHVEYMDAALVSNPGRDGIHLTEEGHAQLADAIYQKIQEIVK